LVSFLGVLLTLSLRRAYQSQASQDSGFSNEQAMASSSVNGDGSTAVPLGGSVGPDPSVPEVVWLIRVAGLDRK
tara:strand:- start:47 stop:268 length:222 start_codon:yes stop_codon:yes gene_type:complete